MKGYVVCILGLYNANKPTFIVPKLYLYMQDFEVKSSAANWCVCIVDDISVTPIPAAADLDAQIFVFDTSGELDAVLTLVQRTAVNVRLALTDWGISAVAGDTVRIVLDKIRIVMGHSAESWGLGL